MVHTDKLRQHDKQSRPLRQTRKQLTQPHLWSIVKETKSE